MTENWKKRGDKRERSLLEGEMKRVKERKEAKDDMIGKEEVAADCVEEIVIKRERQRGE